MKKTTKVLSMVSLVVLYFGCQSPSDELDKAVDRAFTKQLMQTGVKADLLKNRNEALSTTKPPVDGDETKPPVNGSWDDIKPPTIGDGGDTNNDLPPIDSDGILDGDINDDGSQDWGNGSNVGNGGNINNDDNDGNINFQP